jgi:hypothetical protein
LPYLGLPSTIGSGVRPGGESVPSILIMNPHPGRSIDLATYDGTAIPNSIDVDPSPNMIALARIGSGLYSSARTQVLGPPTGRFNCHGLVFASRRANIPPANLPNACDINDLLVRDRMRPASGGVALGDVVVYRGEREIEHTGVVSRVDPMGATQVVFVWSKWGALEECEHHVMSCPYAIGAQIEYWRLA